MKQNRFSRLRRILKDEQGQTFILITFMLTGVLALSGLSVEVGHAYFAYEKLLASTDAATMAGAAGMPNTTTATSNVTKYSSQSGELNATPQLQSVTATPTFLCLTTVSTTLNVPCITSTGASGGYNALKVTQTASVTTWFGWLFGVKTLSLSATATAAMKGGTNAPWNIAIVLDTTASMSDSDSGVQCSGTQISCALKGVQALLADLDPCTLGTTCGSTGSTAFDSVALYVFPPVLATTAYKDYGNGACPTSTPTHEYYEVPTLPASVATKTSPSVPLWTYQIVPFGNDYRTSDSASSLNKSSDVVIAAGGAGCAGIAAPGGAGTYYAQAIYQAQSDLVTQQGDVPGSNNAMIILSDGDATATVTYTTTQNCTGSGRNQQCTTTNTGTTSTSDLQQSSANSLNGLTYNNPTSYAYPSALGECGQAVDAANAAAKAKTLVYTIGYGAETSGCTSDATYSDSVTTGSASWGPGDSPCQALGAMASAPNNFYSDDGDGCKAINATNAAITKLTAIFNAITESLTTARLIPNGTT